MKLYDINTIKPLLERHGFRFSKSLGQNFLIQEWVPQQILEASGIDQDCGVLEIGPGIGVLTQELAKQAGKVVAVEMDKSLIPVLTETLQAYKNVSVINGDIMKFNIKQIIEQNIPNYRTVACANLPYNITTPVLKALLESGCFRRITVMIQKEVAQRICAKPGTAEYGAFTVFVNYHASTSLCFDVPPDCFYPQPKVTSSVINLDAIAPPKDLINQDMLFSITRAAFGQRRKTLVNGLSALFAGKLDKACISQVIEDCGHNPLVRGETLSLPEYVILTNAFYNILN